MGDVEDPEIYVAEPIFKWQQTEQGKWVMQHATNLESRTTLDHFQYGYLILIVGEIEEGTFLTEYLLRWNIEKSL